MYDNQSGITEQNGEVSYSNEKMLECMTHPPPPRGALPYVGYIDVCSPKGYVSAVLAINRVSVLTDFGHLGHKKGIVFTL